MKTMTCKQLYGPCDVLIHGLTSEEMMKNSQAHAMEMVAKGDKLHIDAMEAMKNQNMDMEVFMKDFNDKFESQPED